MIGSRARKVDRSVMTRSELVATSGTMIGSPLERGPEGISTDGGGMGEGPLGPLGRDGTVMPVAFSSIVPPR
jgi:hypothetical protein